jgi:competence protein ComQ
MSKNGQELINNQACLLFKDAWFSDETLAVVEECWEYRQAENKKKSNKCAQWFYLTLAATALFSDDLNRGILAALAMELLALAGDILDDLADNDNNTVPWRRMAPALALHAGACFLTLSFQALAQISDPRQVKDLTSLFSATGSRACDGQIREIYLQEQASVTQEEYLKTIGKKSASLASCACEAGAIAGGASSENRVLMSRYGYNIGMVAQIHNDLRDIFHANTKSDFEQRKKSLPVLYLQNVLQGEPDWDKDELLQILTDTGAVNYCIFISEIYISEAFQALDQVSVPTIGKKELMSIVAP